METNLDRTRLTSLMRRAPASYWLMCLLVPPVAILSMLYLNPLVGGMLLLLVAPFSFCWIFFTGGFEETGTRPKGIDGTRILLGFVRDVQLPLVGLIRKAEPLTIATEDLREGIAIHGARGSGRTSLMTSICGEVAMVGGGALILANDEFAFPDTYREILLRASEHGREDDVFVLDFARTARRSATLDLFEDLSDLDVAVCLANAARRAYFMDDEMATTVSSLLLALVPHARVTIPNGPVDIRILADVARFERLAQLLEDDSKKPDTYICRALVQPVLEHLRSIPGFDPHRGRLQSAKVLAEIDRVESVVVPTLHAIAGFDDILSPRAADHSMRDVVLGKRILLVNLPSDDTERAMIVELISGSLARTLDIVAGPRLGAPFVLFDDASGIDWNIPKAMLARHGRAGFGFVGTPVTPPGDANEPGISIHMRSNGALDAPRGVDRADIRDQRTGDFVLVRGGDVHHCTALRVHPSRWSDLVTPPVADLIRVEKDLVR